MHRNWTFKLLCWKANITRAEYQISRYNLLPAEILQEGPKVSSVGKFRICKFESRDKQIWKLYFLAKYRPTLQTRLASVVSVLFCRTRSFSWRWEIAWPKMLSWNSSHFSGAKKPSMRKSTCVGVKRLLSWMQSSKESQILKFYIHR